MSFSLPQILTLVLLALAASAPPAFLLWQAYRRRHPSALEHAIAQSNGESVELPDVDTMLGDAHARSRALAHIGSVGFDADGHIVEGTGTTRTQVYSEIFVTRLDGGIQTLERKPSEPGDAHLERARLLAHMLEVEFREI